MSEKSFNVLSFLAHKTKGVWDELARQVVSLYFWKDLVVVALGALFYAVGFGILIYPQRITTGGLTGFCNLFTLSLGIPVDVPYNIINIGLLVITFLMLDKNFFIKTLVGVFFIGLIISVTTGFSVPDPSDPANFQLMILADQPVVALIIGSIIIGLGLGLVFSVNGSTGGTDVVVALISKYKNMSLGRIFIFVDGSIVLMSFFVNVYLSKNPIPPAEAFNTLVFSIIQVLCVSMTLDWYLNSNRQSVQFMVFSSKADEINQAVIQRLKRGCTKLEARGGYTDQPGRVLVVVVRKQQAVVLSRIIEEIDPNAFVSQSLVRGVYGQGFESIKKSL